MTQCPAVGQQGTMKFIDGFEDWYVICPLCGTASMGGGRTLVDHKDRRDRRTAPPPVRAK